MRGYLHCPFGLAQGPVEMTGLGWVEENSRPFGFAQGRYPTLSQKPEGVGHPDCAAAEESECGDLSTAQNDEAILLRSR